MSHNSVNYFAIKEIFKVSVFCKLLGMREKKHRLHVVSSEIISELWNWYLRRKSHTLVLGRVNVFLSATLDKWPAAATTCLRFVCYVRRATTALIPYFPMQPVLSNSNCKECARSATCKLKNMVSLLHNINWRCHELYCWQGILIWTSY